jgi:demethylmenaquinone methyltransferase/2-methoxy-6-polyprenyl-1,4-benzoquinol methylase
MASLIRRVTRSKSAAQASYNRLSSWYDALAGSSEKKYRDLGLRKLNAQPGERILELGFGTGHCLVALAQAVGPTGAVHGLDLSDGMLKIAQERLRAAGLESRVTLQQGDAAQLSFEPGTFDGVFTSFTLELFDTPEIPLVLAQCWRVLRPGGRLCLVSMVRPARPGLAVNLYEWFHERMPNYVDCRPIFAQDSLKAAGFIIQEADALIMWGLPVEIILALKPA